MSAIRLVQFTLTVLLSVHLLLIAATNITDYGVNFEFLRQVAGMEDTFSSQKAWRSVTNPFFLHPMYWIVLAAETLSGWLCALGARRMWINRFAPDNWYETGKRPAIYGALIALSLWFGVFLVVGGEWFLMWQSKTWNALPTAYSLSAIYGLALLILLKRD